MCLALKGEGQTERQLGGKGAHSRRPARAGTGEGEEPRCLQHRAVWGGGAGSAGEGRAVRAHYVPRRSQDCDRHPGPLAASGASQPGGTWSA